MVRVALDKAEKELLEEVREELIPYDPSLPSVLDRSLPLLVRLTDAEFAGSYCPKRTGDFWDLDFVYGIRKSADIDDYWDDVTQALSRIIRSAPQGLALARVERFEQNQAMSAREVRGEEYWFAHPLTQAVLPAMGMNTDSHDLRVLLSDRGVLLAWLGLYGPQRFDERQKRLLQLLVPEIRKAAIVERALGKAALDHAALLAAMEAIPTAAYLSDAWARVAYANQNGRREFEQRGRTQKDRLASFIQAAKQGRECLDAQVTPLTVRGLPTHYLIVEQSPAPELEVRLRQVDEKYKLGPKQLEVLRLILEGDSNKTIALALTLSVRTVEHHVTNLMRKLEVDSRSALISSVLGRRSR